MTKPTYGKSLLLLALCLLGSLTVCEPDDHDDHDEETLLSQSEIWGFGFLAGLAVSCIGFLTALMIVFCRKLVSASDFEMIIRTLFSLGLGALIGDVFVHIIPHSFENEDMQSSYIALTILCSLFLFLVIERAFAACGVSHSHWVNENVEAQNNHKVSNTDGIENQLPNDSTKRQEKGEANQANVSHTMIATQNVLEMSSEQEAENNGKTCLENLRGKGSLGYLNLIGSLIHNFLDGLAIGIAFSTGDKQEFVPVLVAVIAHEIPREMGDVAILLKNQFSRIQTILCNGFVNFAALIGLFIGLATTSMDETTKLYLLLFVAGNFLYISADIWQHIFKNDKFYKNFIEFLGLATGVGVMYLLLLIETGHSHEDHDDH